MAAKKTTAKKSPSKESKRPASKPLKVGDKVAWTSAGGSSVGRVVKKVTGTAKVKGHVAKASPADPQYVVQSDKSGGKAIHKPAGLKRRA